MKNDTQNTIPDRSAHLVSYVNRIALSTPGWDNNDITKNDFLTKLCTRFSKDLKDSNLLKDSYFAVEDIVKANDNTYSLSLKVYDARALSSINTPNDSTRIYFSVYSQISDSLAKSIKNGELYYIDDFAKDKADSTYTPDMGNAQIMQNFGDTHTIYSCWLGSYHIQLKKIRPILESKQ